MGDKTVIYRSQLERQRDEGFMVMQDWAITNVYPIIVIMLKAYLIGILPVFLILLVVDGFVNRGFNGIKRPIQYSLIWPIMIIAYAIESKFWSKLWSGK